MHQHFGAMRPAVFEPLEPSNALTNAAARVSVLECAGPPALSNVP